MNTIKLFAKLFLLMASVSVFASVPIIQQWKSGLSGARLTSYSGSVVSSHSSLTVIDFCGNGRYTYYKEGSWSVEGRPGGTSIAGGASNNTIHGLWDITQTGPTTQLVYQTDNGETGSFVIYLQANGRVNIGGVDYAAQKGGADC